MHPDPRRARRRAPSRVCAASFSWWGKTRSLPPPWISKPTPSSSSAIAEHSMCQPGRPRPHGRVPGRVLALLLAPSRARSRAGPPCGRRPRRPRPGPSASSRRCESVAVGRVASARGSRRRRRPRRRGRASISASISSTIAPIVSLGERLVVGAAEAEAVGVGDVGGGHLARELRARHAARARGVVDLVVDVGDVGDERRRRSPRARGSA